MSTTHRAARAAVVLVAGGIGVMCTSSIAGAQIRRQAGAQGAQAATQPPPPRRASPRVVTPQPANGLRIGYAGERNQGSYGQHRQSRGYLPPVIYYPVSGYGYGYAPSGCGASVCDANGNRIMRGFDEPAYNQPMSPAAVPDLSGSPYVALEGGVISVDFGNGDRRNVAACAQQAAESTPDGQPRTIFYSPQADGLILRAGSRGQVVGTPPAGAMICYGLDQYGRVALAY